VTVNVQGPAVFDDTNLAIQAALNGVGIGLTFEQQVAGMLQRMKTAGSAVLCRVARAPGKTPQRQVRFSFSGMDSGDQLRLICRSP
jgi:hypothetical protein